MDKVENDKVENSDTVEEVVDDVVEEVVEVKVEQTNNKELETKINNLENKLDNLINILKKSFWQYENSDEVMQWTYDMTKIREDLMSL